MFILAVDFVLGNLTIVATVWGLDRVAGTKRLHSNWRAVAGVLLFHNVLAIFMSVLLHRWASRCHGQQVPKVQTSGEKNRTDTRRVLKLAAQLRRPAIAYPTVLLSLLSCGSWAFCVVGGSLGRISTPLAFAGAAVSTFVAFTPMHDAVHNAVCPRNRALNNLVGTLSSAPFLGLFRLFKVIHLMHHRYTNDHDSAPNGSSLDPDNWAGEGAEWQLPLRWATVFFYYIAYMFRLATWQQQAEAGGGAGGRRQRREYMRVYITSTLVLRVALSAAAWALGSGLFKFWVAPLFVATSYLMFVFDYLPHRPHLVPYKEDKYLSTSVVSSVFDGFLTPFLLSQNYHNIHHLYPFLPFYRYGRVWRRHKDELIRRGTRVLPFFLSGGRARYLEELSGRGTKDLRAERER